MKLTSKIFFDLDTEEFHPFHGSSSLFLTSEFSLALLLLTTRRSPRLSPLPYILPHIIIPRIRLLIQLLLSFWPPRPLKVACFRRTIVQSAFTQSQNLVGQGKLTVHSHPSPPVSK